MINSVVAGFRTKEAESWHCLQTIWPYACRDRQLTATTEWPTI